MYTSWCGSPLVVTSVPSGSIVSPSRYVQWGNTPLLRASLNGHAEVARLLLESGSSVQEQNNVGWPKGASAKCPVAISCYFCCSLCLSDKILNHTECKVWPSPLINLIKANWSVWLSHVLWCHEYYCTDSVWFSRNFCTFWRMLFLPHLCHSTHLI